MCVARHKGGLGQVPANDARSAKGEGITTHSYLYLKNSKRKVQTSAQRHGDSSRQDGRVRTRRKEGPVDKTEVCCVCLSVCVWIGGKCQLKLRLGTQRDTTQAIQHSTAQHSTRDQSLCRGRWSYPRLASCKLLLPAKSYILVQ